MKQSLNKKPVLFAIIGGINTVLDFLLLFVFVNFAGFPKVVANTLSTGITFIISFFANKKYTFSGGGENVKREFLLFTIITLFGLWVLQNIVISILAPTVKTFFADENLALLVAKLLATGVSMVWNFVMYDKVVFKQKEKNE